MKGLDSKQPNSKKQSRKRNWMLLFLACGIGLTVKGGYDAYQALRSYFWASTEGQILSSTVTRVKHGTEPASYYASISYEYEVGGARFIGDKVFIGEYGTGSPGPMQEIVDRYPVGKRVTVYYDAHDPKKAVLEKGARLASFGLLLIGLLFSTVGLGGYLLWDELNKTPQYVSRRASEDTSSPKNEAE